MKLTYWLENIKRQASLSIIYYTTSLLEALKILETGFIQPKDTKSFVLFSEKPKEGDVTFVFDLSAIKEELVKVQYTESWFHRFPEHASFIAGEEWRNQFKLEDWLQEEDFDETGEIDHETEAMAYLLAEIQAFKDKEPEQAKDYFVWMSKRTGKSMPLKGLLKVKAKRGKELLGSQLKLMKISLI